MDLYYSVQSLYNKDLAQKCNISNQYKEYYKTYAYYPTFADRGQELYTQPCLQMTFTYNYKETKREISGGSQKIHFIITHESKVYKMIENYREFGLGGLWSGIGGLVGMFLGYSLLQIPNALSNSLMWIKQKLGL